MDLVVGAACLIRHGDNWLFEVQKPGKWRMGPDGIVTIGIGCIGGSREGEESPLEALQREAVEEIGCAVRVVAPATRLSVGPDNGVRELAPGEGEPLAALYWEEAKPGYIPGAKVVVFLGTPVGDPAPGDLPALVFAPWLALVALWSGGCPVPEVAGLGGRVVARHPLPPGARMEPVGTVAVLGRLYHAAPELVRQVLGLE